MKARISPGSIILFILGLQTLITAIRAATTGGLRAQKCTSITTGSIDDMLEEMNYARAILPAAGMPEVVWNATVADALAECENSIGGNWFYSQYNNPVKVAMNRGPFSGDYLISDLPPPGLPTVCDFSKFAKDGWAFLWRDTNQCVDSGQGSLQFNFHMRMIKQKPCFHLAACNPDQYNNFGSCFPNEVTNKSGKFCSWAWQYYARGVMDHLYQIAAVRTGVNSPVAIAAGKDHTDSYFLFGLFLKGVLPVPPSDVPFVEGKPGSDCPKDFSSQTVRLSASKHVMCVHN